MNGETDLKILLKTLHPFHNIGDYVFCSIKESKQLQIDDFVLLFKEQEGTTAILSKEKADSFHFIYTNVYAWITLSVHSSLEAVGLTAAFSTALSKAQISCNVVAAYFHDHIFVPKNDVEKAMDVLRKLSENSAI
jgi:uncharacterized protein